MTVGTPQGESETVSAGIVSAVSRTTALDIDGTEAYFVGLIQTDAMINSGSSGGALVNADGELVGITTMSATTTGDWAGMTYAIPSNYAMGLAQQIIETGTVEYPQLGVSVVDLLDAYYSGYYSLKDASSVLGAYVASVVEGSGADEAGIQEGDLIVAADGQDVSGSDDLVIAVRGHAIGDTMTLTVERDGESIDVEVTLGSDGGTSATGEADEEDDEADEDEGWFGFGLGDQGGSQEGGQGGFGFGGQDEGQGGFGLLGGSDSHNNGSDSHGGSRSGSNGSSGRLGGFGAYTDSIGA
jgi:putative serine protease PepD